MTFRGKNNWTFIAIVAALLVIAWVIPVTAAPTADFTNATPRLGTAPLTVAFTDLSTSTLQLTYAWDFTNDGVIDSTGPNPSHEYTTIGSFTVNLTVTDSDGSDSEVKGAYIVVAPAPVAPVAAFTNTTPRSGTAPLTVAFTDQSTGSISTYAWDFGDGGTSTNPDPSHQYNTAGTYTVTLTVTGPGGSDSEVKGAYIIVAPAPVAPVAAFTNTTPRSGTAPLTVAFTDQSTGSISTYAWDFNNDGTNESILQNPAPFTYTTAGAYTVKLTVNGPGGSDSETKANYIIVGEVPPVAGFSATPSSGPKPLNVQFTDASTGVINTYAWDFGDGHTSNAQNPSHNYPVIGSYTVTLTVTGPGGSDFETKNNYIIVGDTPPLAGFSATPTSGQKPLNVQFTDASTGNVSSYTWNFGDGSTSTLRNPSHQYTAVDTYTVTLTVNGPGGSDFETKTNYITVTNATTNIGVYKDGVWYLDYNGNGGTGAGTDKPYIFGAPGWTSVTGNWNGDGNGIKIGIYKDGTWYLDWNGNGAWDDGTDKVFIFGAPGWTSVVGDWNGDGSTKIGLYKDGTWYLDWNGNGAWDDGTDKVYIFGTTGWTSVVGDWNGNGSTKIGIYKDGTWYLDWNGNGAWDDGTDKVYIFGTTGWTSVVGDWNGDGSTKIGLYKDGTWYLDWNGNGAWDDGTDKVYIFGTTGWTSVVGDWNGDGSTKIGLYRDGTWYLDWNGNGAWDDGTDKVYIFGTTGWTSVVGDWNGDGSTKIGLYRDGTWYLDWNGDGAYTTGVNTAFTFRGVSGWTSVVGDWNGDGKTKIGVYKEGAWYLDWNGNGVWDEGTDKFYNNPARNDFIPVIGDWNGDGKSKIGVYRWGYWSLDFLGAGTYTNFPIFIGPEEYAFSPVVGDWNGDGKSKMGAYRATDGTWRLDYYGNRSMVRDYSFGTSGFIPVVGDWNGDGKSKIGVFKDGNWRLDYYGNGSLIRMYSFGATGSSPVVGDWNGDGKSKIGVFKDGNWRLDNNGNGAWDAGTDKEYSFGATGYTPVVGKWS